MDDPARAAQALKAGVLACRAGRWREGYDLLTRLAQAVEGRKKLPSIFYSYLGVAMARCEGRKRDGLELCRHAVQLQPRQVENHLNLASLYVMSGRRGLAIQSLRRGLRINPRHARLLEFEQELGVRRTPVFPFLSRSSVLNKWTGKVRHRVETWRQERQDERDELEELGLD